MLHWWWGGIFLAHVVCFYIQIIFSLPRASLCAPGRACVTGESNDLFGLVAKLLGFSYCIHICIWQRCRSVLGLSWLGSCTDLSASPLPWYSLGYSSTIQAIKLHICPTPTGTGRGQCVGRRSVLSMAWRIISSLTCSNRSGYEYSPGNLLSRGKTLSTGRRVCLGWQVEPLGCKSPVYLAPGTAYLLPSPCMRHFWWRPPLYLIGGVPWISRRGSGRR